MATAFVVLVATAGCSGNGTHPARPTTAAQRTSSSRSAGQRRIYETKMRALGTRLGAFIQRVGVLNDAALANAATEQTAATLIARELIHLQVRLRSAAGELAAITPPDDVRTAHAALRQGVLDYAAELTKVISLVRSGNLTAVKQIGDLAGVRKMEAASAAIKRKGYSIVESS